MSVMVRVDKATRDRIKKIAQQEGRNMIEIIRVAIDKYVQDKVLDEFNASYARIRRNPEKWSKIGEERELWETTLMDGLET